METVGCHLRMSLFGLESTQRLLAGTFTLLSSEYSLPPAFISLFTLYEKIQLFTERLLFVYDAVIVTLLLFRRQYVVRMLS